MKKICFMLCLLSIAAGKVQGQTQQRGIDYAAGLSAETLSDTYYEDYTSYKRKGKQFLISGSVVCGAGILAFGYASIHAMGEIRDNVEHDKRNKKVQALAIIGGSLVAASLPLFIIGTVNYRKYKNMVALQLHLEPGYDYKGNTASSLQLGLRLHF